VGLDGDSCDEKGPRQRLISTVSGQKREGAEIEALHTRSGLFLTLVMVIWCVVSLIRVLDKDAFVEGHSTQADSQSKEILSEVLEQIKARGTNMNFGWYAKYDV
jgi:hypothetical protein